MWCLRQGLPHLLSPASHGFSSYWPLEVQGQCHLLLCSKTLSEYTCFTSVMLSNTFFSRDVVFAQNVASKGWCCQVPPSGLTTIVFVKPVNVSAALCVLCAANLPVQAWPCSAAVYATGLFNAQGRIIHWQPQGTVGSMSFLCIFLNKTSLMLQVGPRRVCVIDRAVGSQGHMPALQGAAACPSAKRIRN